METASVHRVQTGVVVAQCHVRLRRAERQCEDGGRERVVHVRWTLVPHEKDIRGPTPVSPHTF